MFTLDPFFQLHEHVFTGKKDTSIADVIERMKKGQFATFARQVYQEFFFPAFLRYHATYRSHVLCAGAWLLTGVYNLRNQPKVLNVDEKGVMMYAASSVFHRCMLNFMTFCFLLNIFSLHSRSKMQKAVEEQRH